LAPTGSKVEVKIPTPVGSSDAVPSVVGPFAKLTVPVGTAGPGPDSAATVAISSTGNPCVGVAAGAVKVRVTCEAAVTGGVGAGVVLLPPPVEQPAREPIVTARIVVKTNE
jgi:hypothetical protein